MLAVLSVIINILLLILIIGILTFVHEGGHFIAAKLVGAKVLEFSVGFGPLICSKEYKGTQYSLRAIPFGGYCQILGDGDPDDADEKKKKEYKDSKYNLNNKTPLQQIFVMLAGVTMNVVLSIVIFHIMLAFSGWEIFTSPEYENINTVGAKVEKVLLEEDSKVDYVSLQEGGVAEAAGFPSEGYVKAINGESITFSDELSKYLSNHKGENVTMNVCDKEDNCQDYAFTISPEGKIGIMLQSNYFISISYKDNKLFAGVSHLINYTGLVFTKLGSLFRDARSTGDYSELSNSVSGPIGMYLIIDYIKQYGIIPLMEIVAELSLSLAIMNVLPVPALDGGRVLILLIETILRRKLSDNVKEKIINISFILLMVLVVLIMVKDIINIDEIKAMLSN